MTEWQHPGGRLCFLVLLILHGESEGGKDHAGSHSPVRLPAARGVLVEAGGLQVDDDLHGLLDSQEQLLQVVLSHHPCDVLWSERIFRILRHALSWSSC